MIDRRAVGQVAVITIDRDERRNALDVAHCEALEGALGTALHEGARCVVVTGAGRAFCAGADFDQVAGRDFRRALYSLLRRVTEAPVPVIAAVAGPAIGAGLQLAIACDLRVAGTGASFAVPSARLGLAVDPWTIHRLASLVGAGAAASLLLASDTLDVAGAVAAGLVQRQGELADALALAEDIASAAPLTLAYSKRALHTFGSAHPDDRSLDEQFEACWASRDLAEGLRARAERRAPRFEGR